MKRLLASLLFTAVVEGHEFFIGRIYAFLIEHPTKGGVVYGLGLRKGCERLSRAVYGHIAGLLYGRWKYLQTVLLKLTKVGGDLRSIKAVILWRCSFPPCANGILAQAHHS